MNMVSKPLHKICVDKSDYFAEQSGRKCTADLTKDVFRKEYEQKNKKDAQ
ncbi:MAG: hypothetical protein K0R55_1470 [Sporomusa sp.]|nr:hypothetical protein [Sporomusa sp.]